MSSNRTLDSVCVSGPAEWILVVGRLIVNSATVILALCMIWFIARRPALHANTFNVLFLSSFVVDILANLSRILLKYLPSMLCGHWLIRELVGAETPLATIINASEWYLSYASICCGFFFNFDHMILVVFPRYYARFCNHYTKWFMFWLTWTLPLVWVLPMAHRCCRSTFLGKTATPVFVNPIIQDLYDTTDMILESLLYTPVVFVFNCLTTCVLQLRYRKCLKSRDQPPRSGVLNDLGRSGLLGLSGVEWVRDRHGPTQPYLRIEMRPTSGRRASTTQHRKIIDEMDLSLINLIDQMIDAVGVLFYMSFWGGNNKWVYTNIPLSLTLHDVCWELSTLTPPYIFLVMFPDIRRELFGFYSAVVPADQPIYQTGNHVI